MFTRARLAGLWILGSVISPAEMEHLDDYSGALDGGAGGTYAPSGALILGGAGVTLSGTNHHVAGTLTVDSLALISVASGGMIKLDGSGTNDIELKVVSSVASINVKANARIDVQKSGDLNIYGLATLKDNGGGLGNPGGELLVEDTASIQVASGGALSAAAGSAVTINGDWNVGSTGVATWGASSNLAGIAGAFAQWAGEWWFADILKITSACDFIIQGAANWIQYETARTWSCEVVSLLPMTFIGATTGPDNPDVWIEKSDLTTAPCIRTRTRTVSGSYCILRVKPPPPGGVMTGATITSKGTDVGSLLSNLPKYQIVSWDDSAAAGLTTHSALTDDAGSMGTFPAVSTQTEITATGSAGDRTIISGRSYGIYVVHPYEAVNSQGARFYEAHLLGTTDKHQI